MLPVENNFNKIGLPHVYIALFRCLWVPGGGLEPFRRVLRSDGWLPLPRQHLQQFQKHSHTLSLILNGQNRNAIVNRLMSRINRIQCLDRLWLALLQIFTSTFLDQYFAELKSGLIVYSIGQAIIFSCRSTCRVQRCATLAISVQKVSRSPTPSWQWGKRGKIYSECMGKIVILMLDNLRKVDILQFQ